MVNSLLLHSFVSSNGFSFQQKCLERLAKWEGQTVCKEGEQHFYYMRVSQGQQRAPSTGTRKKIKVDVKGWI